MSTESYACHIAPPGTKTHQIVEQIIAERKAAANARYEYARTKGAVGVYANDSSVSGLLFKDGAKLPEHWRKESRHLQGDGSILVMAAPKAKDRTKATRDAVKAIKAELAALPKLPGGMEFARRIGTSFVFIAMEMRYAWYSRIGDTTFVFTPWTVKDTGTNNPDFDEVEPTVRNREAFLPEGCERVGLSVYYAANEKFDAEKAAA